MSYHTWRRVEFVDENDSSSRNSNANRFGLSINSRGNGFLRIEKFIQKKCFFQEIIPAKSTVMANIGHTFDTEKTKGMSTR